MKAIDVTRGMLVLIEGKRARVAQTVGDEVVVDFSPGLIKSDFRKIPGETEVFPFMVATKGTERVELDPAGEALSVDVKAGTAIRKTLDGRRARVYTTPRENGTLRLIAIL